MKKTFVVRIRSSAGQLRLEVDPDSTIGHVIELAAAKFHVQPGDARLYREIGDNQPLDSSAVLASLPLISGTILHFVSNSPITFKPQSSSIGLSHSGISDIPKESKLSDTSATIKSITYNSSTAENTSSKDHKLQGITNSSDLHLGQSSQVEDETVFLAFDGYLAKNGYETHNLPMYYSLASVRLIKGQMNRIPPAITLKHQPYRYVDLVELMNVDEVKNFVNHWHYEKEMITQRGGWMYGYYREDPHFEYRIRAVCEAIYEPPQRDVHGSVIFDNDPFLETVDQIATRLGLERIGYIFTHLNRPVFITSEEFIVIARFQLSRITHMHYTKYPISTFVTCTVSPNPQEDGQPTINAFMVSDLGMAAVRDGLVSDIQDNPSVVKIINPKPNEVLPQILESGKSVTSFDVDWVIIRVAESAPIKVRSLFQSTIFPRENRENRKSASDISDHLKNVKFKQFYNQIDDWKPYADFHFLLCIAKLFDFPTAATICDAIVNRVPVERDLEDILRTLA